MNERDRHPPTAPACAVPRRSSRDALEILAAIRGRRLTGGELLLLCEEAAPSDLGRAALEARGDAPEIGFVAGPPPLPADAPGLEAAETLLRDAAAACPGRPLHGFCPDMVHRHAGASGLQTLEVLRRLQSAGLASLGGDGATILSERIRGRLPGRTTPRAWIEICEEAHYLGLATTATMTFGHAETCPERIEHLLRLRDSQDRTRGWTAFAPLLYRPGEASPSHPAELAPPTAADPAADHLRTLALSRLALDNFDRLQAVDVSLDPDQVRSCILHGANELVDSVPAGADSARLVHAAGFTPVRRDHGEPAVDVPPAPDTP